MTSIQAFPHTSTYLLLITPEIPIGTANRLENVLRNFLSEGPKMEGKMHLVNWKKIQLPDDKGGFGIGNIRKRNQTLLSK